MTMTTRPGALRGAEQDGLLRGRGHHRPLHHASARQRQQRPRCPRAGGGEGEGRRRQGRLGARGPRAGLTKRTTEQGSERTARREPSGCNLSANATSMAYVARARASCGRALGQASRRLRPQRVAALRRGVELGVGGAHAAAHVPGDVPGDVPREVSAPRAAPRLRVHQQHRARHHRGEAPSERDVALCNRPQSHQRRDHAVHEVGGRVDARVLRAAARPTTPRIAPSAARVEEGHAMLGR
eukprot:scaffold593_cov382-Prasinococcus_capsulatus_cf.AAC.29